jgi:hypothetical protein
MKKNYRYLALANTLLAFSAPAMAGGAFDGINASVGVGFDSLLTSASDTDPSYYGPSQSLTYREDFGQSGKVGKLELGYSRAFDDGFNLAASAFGTFGDSHAGEYSYLGGPSSLQYTLTPRWGVAVEPGYYLGPTTLGYIKLGYARATGRMNFTGLIDAGFESAGGPLVGVGFKQMLTDRAYVGLEVYRVDYGKTSSTNTILSSYRLAQSQIHTGLSLGYAFDGAPRPPSSAGNARPFDGLQFAVGLNALAAGSSLYEAGYQSSTELMQATTKPFFSVGYSHSLPSDFNITGSIFTIPGTVNAGGTSASNGALFQFRMKNLVGVATEIGYAFTPGVLGYLKLGYAQASSEFVGRASTIYEYGKSRGALYGFGFKSMLTSKIFVAVDVANINFNRKIDQQGGDTSVKPRINFGGLSLGYILN